MPVPPNLSELAARERHSPPSATTAVLAAGFSPARAAFPTTSLALGEAHDPAGPEATFDRLQIQVQRFLGDQVTPIRLASHLAVLIVAGIVLLVSQSELPEWQISLRSLPDDGLFAEPGEQPAPFLGENPLAGTQNSVGEATETFQRAVVPFISRGQADAIAGDQVQAAQSQTSGVPAVRTQIETYSVKPGDTVHGIAARFSIKPETIQWANPELEANPDILRIGDRLVILPVDGVLHVVRAGDTLLSLASRYKVAAESIVGYPLNGLDDLNTPLAIGSQIVVPEGTKPYITRQVATYSGPVPESASRGTGALMWPSSGRITQPHWNGHRAIDIGAQTGTPISAADSGYVTAARTGWNNGYGRMVIIDHGNGYVTLYAHMNSIFVREGENVSKGAQIGTVGNTGNSTGSHLHFEVRYQGVARNPFNYLP